MHVNRLSRREAVRVVLFAAGGAAMASATTMSSQAVDPPSADLHDGWIDAHVHIWTEDRKRYPLAAGYKPADMQPPSFTAEELFQQAAPHGVSRIVLIQMSFYKFDNSYLLDTIKAHPGRFAGVAVIDENARPADEMRRLKKLGVRGFRIGSSGKDLSKWLTGDSMAAMWKCGAEEHLAMCCLVNPDALPSVDAMCAKHRDTPVVIDHFARIGIDGAIRERDLDNLCRLARHKHVSVKVSAFYALGKKTPPYDDLAPMVRRLVDAFGPKRLMWATDCPFQVQRGHTYRASLEFVRDRLDFLSAEDKRWLLRDTARGVFFA